MLFSPVAHPSLRDSMDRATLPPPFFPSRPSILIRVSDHPPWLRTSPAVDGRGQLASAGGKWVGARGQRAPTEGTDGRLRGACVRARVLPPRRAPLLMPYCPGAGGRGVFRGALVVVDSDVCLALASGVGPWGW